MTKRRQYTEENKAEIILKHLVDKEAVSDVCEQYQIKPNMFYRWLAEFKGNAAAGLSKTRCTQNESRTTQSIAARISAQKERQHYCLCNDGTDGVKKKEWGTLNGWVELDLRDRIVDYIKQVHEETRLPYDWILRKARIGRSRFYDWW